MLIKCHKCGKEGSKAEFKYLHLAESAGPNSYRQCPDCHAAIYCYELETNDPDSKSAWGAGHLRGQIFTKANYKSHSDK